MKCFVHLRAGFGARADWSTRRPQQARVLMLRNKPLKVQLNLLCIILQWRFSKTVHAFLESYFHKNTFIHYFKFNCFDQPMTTAERKWRVLIGRDISLPQGSPSWGWQLPTSAVAARTRWRVDIWCPLMNFPWHKIHFKQDQHAITIINKGSHPHTLWNKSEHT